MVEPLELHSDSTLHLFLDVEPGQVVLAVERGDVEEGRVRVEHRDEVVVELGREAEPLDDPQPAVDTGEAAAVVAFGHILRPEALVIPPLGCINAHGSLLPKLRGAAPIAWAVINGEKVSGVTTMLLDSGMDTGPMLLRREVALAPDETAGSLHDKLAPVAAELLVETLAKIVAGTVSPQPQDGSQATIAPMLKKEDGRIDWTRPAAEIERRVRGLNPWPGSYTGMNGETLKVIRVKVEAGKRGAAGEVLACDKEGILVAAGEGAVRLVEIQPPGKKAMDACSWLSGHCLQTGRRFN